MQHQLRLKDSPIAIESRYQLWKINPQHPWLDEFSDDVQRWNRGVYYPTYNTLKNGNNDASLDHNKYSNQRIEHNDSSYNEVDIYDDDENDDFESIQTRKREKFYENRKKLGHNDFSSPHNDQHFDYERQNNAKKKFKGNKPADHSQSDFFDSAASNNRFDDSTQGSSITWGK